MQRVLFVDHATVLGGAEHSLLLLLKHLNRDLFEPLLACPPGKLADHAKEAGIDVVYVTLPRLRRSATAPWHLLQDAIRLTHLAKNQHCDLLCSNTMRASIYTSVAAHFAHKPWLWYVRDVFSPGSYVNAMVRRATSIIAVSQAAAAPLRAAGAQVHVIHNGIELDAFKETGNAKQRNLWGIPQGACAVGIAGRVRHIKGQHHFIHAVAKAQEQAHNLWGVIIGATIFQGEDNYLQELQSLAQRLNVENRIVFAGYTDDIPGTLPALDMLASCTLEPEPFGRTVIEGMAAGLPIIAYDEGGPSEVITDGKDGWLVKPRDIDALAERMTLLANDAERRQAMGKAALATAKQYDIESLTRQVEKVILSMLDQSKGAAPCT